MVASMTTPLSLRTQRRAALALPFALAFLLLGCASPVADDPRSTGVLSALEGSDATDTTEATSDNESDADPEPVPAPATQEETCDWDAAALPGASTATPGGQEGDLETVLIGAWQHTHFDVGGGFEPVEHDIRYVFPSVDRMLYCQHVPGITDHAENAGDITWDGETLVLPSGDAGYTVAEWDANTMVWINHFDDSRYLLQRR